MSDGRPQLSASYGLDVSPFIAGVNQVDVQTRRLEETASRMSRGIDRQVQALQRSAEAMGMGTREARLAELAYKGASQWQLAAADAALKLADANERAANGNSFLASLQKQADAAGKTRVELLAMQAAELGVAEKAAPLIARLGQQHTSTQALGGSTKLTAYQTQQLSFQLNDLFVQMASGQSPVTALIQQGSQLNGTFGGLGGTMKAIGSLFTAVRVAFGAVAAAAGVFGLAVYQASEQNKEFQRSLALTGNAAGQTSDSFIASYRAIAEGSKLSVGASRDVLQALVSTGQFGPQSINAVATAVGTLATASGQSADEVVKDFASMKDGVAKWAEAKNKQYNFLTPATLAYLRALESQEKTEEAAKVAADALTQTLQGRARPLGTIEGLLKSGKDLWSKYWDAALDVGRPETLGDKFSKVEQQLADAQKRSKLAAFSSAPAAIGGQTTQDLSETEFSVGKQRFREMDAANNAAQQIAKNNEEIRKMSEGHEAALTSLALAGIRERLAAADFARDQERAALDQSYEARLLGERSYATASYAIEKDRLDKREAALNAEIALERKRQTTSPEDVLQKQARVQDLETQRFGNRTDRLKLDEQARKGELLPADAGARLNASISEIEKRLQNLTDAYANSERILEGVRATGLLDEQAYFDARRAFILLNQQANETAAQERIDALTRERNEQGLVGKALVDNQRQVAEATARRTKTQQDAATALVLLNQQQEASVKRLNDAFKDAQVSAQGYLSAIERSNARDVKAVGQGDRTREIGAGFAAIDERAIAERAQTEGQLRRNEITKAEYERRIALTLDTQTKERELWAEHYANLITEEAKFSNGATRALDNYVASAENSAKQVENLFTNAFQGIEDALVKFVQTGKLDFKSLVDSIAADIIRLTVRQQIASFIGPTSSGGGSSIGGYAKLIAGLVGAFGGGAQAAFSQTSLGSSGFGSGLAYGNQDLGGFLATGTNYVPHDGFRATLHKGEAVVPAAYNPANPTASKTMGGRTVNQTIIFQSSGPVSRATQDQLAAAAFTGAQRAAQRNT